MRATLLVFFLAISVETVSAADRPLIVACEAGRWDGYSIYVDQTGSMKSEEDFISMRSTLYEFSEDGLNATITTDRGKVIVPVANDGVLFRTVAYNYGTDFVVDTVFNDGLIIEKFTRVMAYPTSYIFRKKCTVLM